MHRNSINKKQKINEYIIKQEKFIKNQMKEVCLNHTLKISKNQFDIVRQHGSWIMEKYLNFIFEILIYVGNINVVSFTLSTYC